MGQSPVILEMANTIQGPFNHFSVSMKDTNIGCTSYIRVHKTVNK